MNGTVLVRRTHLDYTATKPRPAYAHDDLLFVYYDPLDSSPRAIFFDNEGHVIRYAALLWRNEFIAFIQVSLWPYHPFSAYDAVHPFAHANGRPGCPERWGSRQPSMTRPSIGP